jgi:hypothetical protein
VEEKLETELVQEDHLAELLKSEVDRGHGPGEGLVPDRDGLDLHEHVFGEGHLAADLGGLALDGLEGVDDGVVVQDGALQKSSHISKASSHIGQS